MSKRLAFAVAYAVMISSVAAVFVWLCSFIPLEAFPYLVGSVYFVGLVIWGYKIALEKDIK